MNTTPTRDSRSISMLSSIFQSLSSLHPNISNPSTQAHSTHANPLHTLSVQDTAGARSLFLTLHVLFPHELLPALDLLDRGLVTRLALQHDDSSISPSRNPTRHASEVEGHSETEVEVYYIQSSASATTNHPRKHASSSATFYEVRLDSWNCSCPAFSVSAFQGLSHSTGYDDNYDDNYHHDRFPTLGLDSMPENATYWHFGGVATSKSSGSIPSCKHILAALLAKAAPELFGHGVTVRKVSCEEIVGWGGGWGEFGGG
ncbi:hypothetical protein EDD37DRAFT_510963 [Exophiala viscosa]|uniref:SWIM-type domain-containing protein n=1 Tax=Exophiala viscosa TaxID=2486360 RepID=A0AAN6E1B6_9EURO|nr:hypothetical protein EDD36DRAFT_179829 [Exophiala viscosa]KAI1622216.1 hypothetical protein EDD37DRAFT_510963 [Exophiala viscosa]